MLKPIVLCLLGICLLTSCKTIPAGIPLYFPQQSKRDAEAKEFFRHIHYPYIASRERQRLIERAVRGGMRLDTEAQLLAQFGPPDWKEHVDGYPPKIPPSEIWFYVHTWKRPMGPRDQGKMILFSIRTDDRTIESMQERGLQKVQE